MGSRSIWRAGALASALVLGGPAALGQQPTRPTDGGCSGPDCPLGQIPAAVQAASQAAAAAPEIDPNPDAVGQHILSGMAKANTYDPDNGNVAVHYSYNFERSFPQLWKEEYLSGYANPAYWDKIGFMSWRLKPGVSASEAIQDWLKGRTIAECMTTVRALQTNALRAVLGNTWFDHLFGGKDAPGTMGPLIISPFGSSVNRYLRASDAATAGDPGTIGNRPGKPGEHYYFFNHPQYLLKHPGGAWQGENALLKGRNAQGVQIWTGFGANDMTEAALYKEMVDAYNAPRSARDIQALNERYGSPENWPPQYKEGAYPDQITVKDILSSPPYDVGDGQDRKGGFVLGAGVTLDLSKIRRIGPSTPVGRNP